MRKSIFDIENRLDISIEFKKFIDVLNKEDAILRSGCFLTYFEFVNRYVFNIWEYRDTFIDIYSYLTHIGITSDMIRNGIIDESHFLNFLEFLLNIDKTIKDNNLEKYIIDIVVKNIVPHNIPIILEKMNYEKYENGGKICIRKRDSDVDSILEIVPEDVSLLLLSYNDIRNNNLEAKKDILKGLDLYIEKGKKEYKSFDSKLYDSIGTIVNKMGINHPIDEEPYTNMSKEQIIKWYDKCFKLMIHLIRTKEINIIKEERVNLIKK